MKKIIQLLTVMTVFFHLSALADTQWTGASEIVSGTKYYIVNVETGMYLTTHDDGTYSTRACIGSVPFSLATVTVQNDDSYEIKFDKASRLKYDNSKIWVDGNSSSRYKFTITKIGETNNFRIQNVDKAKDGGYLAPDGTSVYTNLIHNSTNEDLTLWRFVSVDEITSTMASSTTALNPTDITLLFPIADCQNISTVQNQWDNYSSSNWDNKSSSSNPSTIIGDEIEKWSTSADLGNATLYYTKSELPNGLYQVSANMMSGHTSHRDDAEYGGFYLVANDNQTEVKTKYREAPVFSVQALVTNGTLKIGVKRESCISTWVMVDNFKVEYTETMHDVLQDEITTATTLANGGTLSANDRDDLLDAISDATAALSGDDAALVAAYNDLLTAEATARDGWGTASVDNPKEVDAIQNGDFESSSTGWSKSSNLSGGRNNITRITEQDSYDNTAGAFSGEKFYEVWGTYGDTGYLQQEITGLRTGLYRVDISAFTKVIADKGTQFVFANNDRVFIDSRDPKAYQILTYVEDGNLTIGFQQTNMQNDWFGIDNVELYYVGTDATPYYNVNKSKAEAMRDGADFANVKGTERTALTTAIAATPADYAAKISAAQALATACNTMATARWAYDLLVDEIGRATTIEASTTAANTAWNAADATAESVEEAYYALNAVEDAALSAKYSMNITSSKIGSWTDTKIKTNRGQHWKGGDSGESYNESNGWDDNSWSSNRTQTIVLPAGEYLFKVACRASSNATLAITVSGDTQYAPQNGSSGIGINRNGEASFNYSDDFANSSNGYGWQWRYFPISLDDDGYLTITFEGYSNRNHEYFSICNYTLLEKPQEISLDEEETYDCYSQHYSNVTIKRTLTAGKWNTLILPFDVTRAELEETFGEETRVAEYDGIDGEIVNFKSNTGNLVAHTPYLVNPVEVSVSNTYTFNQKYLPLAESTSVEKDNVEFAGNYTAGATIAEGDYFFGSNNTFYRSTGKSKMNAYRAYFHYTGGGESARISSFTVNGEVITDIAEIKNLELRIKNSIYDLQGRKIGQRSEVRGKSSEFGIQNSELKKGIYIVNGKKVVLK